MRRLAHVGVLAGIAACSLPNPPACPMGEYAIDRSGFTCQPLPSSKLAIVEQLCDGGSVTFEVPTVDGGTIEVDQVCGSAAQSAILEAPCDGGTAGAPTATFTLPGSFNPALGDSVTATVCAAQCDDGGETCDAITNVAQPLPQGSDVIRVQCSAGGVGQAGCAGSAAFLQLVE